MKKLVVQRGKPGHGAAGVSPRNRARLRRRKVKAGALRLSAPAQDAKLRNLKLGDLYRPLKKPVTLRLDADVIAWFKKEGRKYQTRINAALRTVMEREMKRG
jgi:uncharacterized protein (DUF4415 family)